MKTLLLCSYRTRDVDEPALGAQTDSDGVTLIDRRIEQLQNLGHEVICVVGGADADELLRVSRRLETCELVFDTNVPSTVFSNVRSGTFAFENEACFVLPIEITPPPEQPAKFLINEYFKIGAATPYAILQIGAPWHFGFPLLLTRTGRKLVQKAEGMQSLVDPRLKSLQVAFETEADLAQATIPL